MAYDISDYDEITILIDNGWQQWYIPKFDFTAVVDEPYITIEYVNAFAGLKGYDYTTPAMDFNDVTFGYTSPSSAAEIETVLLNYRNSAFGGGGVAWGSITGTLSSQTDLQAALDAKLTNSDAAVGARINASVAATPNDTDFVATAESGGSLKKITWTNVKAFLKTYFDTLYTTAAAVIAYLTANYATEIYCASDLPINSDATINDDPVLQFPVDANGIYFVKGCVSFETLGVADFKYCFSSPAGLVWASIRSSFNPVNTATTTNVLHRWATWGTEVQVLAANAFQGPGLVTFEGTFENGGTAGTFAFQWAQVTSDASNTTRKAGSMIKHKKVN